MIIHQNRHPKLKDLMRRPEDHFDKPKDVLKDKRLSRCEQLDIIESWLQNQKALMRASNENMAPEEPNAEPAETISELKNLKSKITKG